MGRVVNERKTVKDFNVNDMTMIEKNVVWVCVFACVCVCIYIYVCNNTLVSLGDCGISHLSHRPMCKAMVNSLHSLRIVYYLFSVHIVHMGTINSTFCLSLSRSLTFSIASFLFGSVHVCMRFSLSILFLFLSFAFIFTQNPE